ncbi:M20 family metallopeptidase [Janibacter sp. GXQ6167]|uniref:M20 metallopeptidase family protein n=1 Tax=Janibacter sp. GXQ6167 TaxID=3240791 RepID=UPI0035254933
MDKDVDARPDLTHRMTRIRRDLHRQPEIGLHLPKTQARVLSELEGLPVEITTGEACSSVTAVLRGSGGPGGPVVLLRADMDALAVQEQTDLEYRSEVDGAMHACGHDLHTAMLVGAAHLLAERRAELPGDVVLMFQPGEEMCDGAAVMLDEGLLTAAGRRPDAAFALHVFSSRLPQGTFVTRSGSMMAAADGLVVTIRGLGGHGSAPHLAIDPVTVAAECVLALQSFVTRQFDVFDPVVVGIGYFGAGDRRAPNAIPETAEFSASVRFWSERSRAHFREHAQRLVAGIAEAHGARAEIRYVEGYPVTINDPVETDLALQTLIDLVGADRVSELQTPLSGSEDFSRVLGEIPGTFVCLGAAPMGVDLAHAADNHSPQALFDDAVLLDGARAYTELATRRLTQLALSQHNTTTAHLVGVHQED